MAALETLADGHECLGIVCGSGFEDRADLLTRLSARWLLLGNSPDTVATLKDPVAFAELCRDAQVPHPETLLTPPANSDGWLVKRVGGAGGWHVRPAKDGGKAGAGVYFQRRVAGTPVSALVLGDGKRVLVLGFSAQWSAPTARHPYRYGGAVRPAALDADLRAAMSAAIARLGERVPLIGLNSADFLVEGADFHLLEINPRPGATFDLFEPDDGSLFALHVAACNGRLPERAPVLNGAMAGAIVYADSAMASVPAVAWPAWTADRPVAGSRIDMDEPVCSAFARAETAAAARRLLDERCADVRSLLRGAAMSVQPLSVNTRAQALIDVVKASAAELKVAVARGEQGETLIDAGRRASGSIAAGVALARICMGGLGHVDLTANDALPRWPWTLTVHSAHPVIACLASQYAGWRLTHGEGKDAYFALGSGPARALARSEPLFETLAYRDTATSAALVMESAAPPPAPVVSKVAQACGLTPDKLTFLYAPTQSLAGMHADRRPRAGSRAAQGPRAEISAAAHRRGHGRRALVAAASRFRHGHGPHQRCDHLWRSRAVDGRRRGGRRARSCREAAKPGLARLRSAVRRDLQALQGRFLRHRSDAVQSRRGHRHRTRNRRELPRRRSQCRSHQCLLRVTR